MRRILVTGAGGFIASHLIPYLASMGFEILAVTRRVTLSFNHPLVSIAPLPTTEADWKGLLQDVAAVVHLAGIAHQRVSANEFDAANHLLTSAMAKAAHQSNVQHFILVSSIGAQTGHSASHILTEADEPRPTNPYGASKLAAEKAVSRSGVPFTILRPVLIDGPGAKGNAAKLERVARIPLPLPLAGLRSKRSMLSIGNFNSAIAVVLFNPNAMGETYVVADPAPRTLPEMIARIRRREGRRTNIFYVNPKLFEFGLRAAGNHLLWQRLGHPLIVDPAKLLALGWSPTED
jgi:UDP-glucose 4-epimerase